MAYRKNALEKPSIPQKTDPKNQKGKAIFQLECARLYYRQGNIKQALEWGHRTLAQKKLDLNIKLQVTDLIACCYRHSYSDKEVYLCLQKSMKYLERFPSEPFAFSIYSNYLEALIALGFKQEAIQEFENYPRYLKGIKDHITWLKHYLIIKKLQYNFAKKYKNYENAWYIIEAINEIGQFIDDLKMIEFAERELQYYDCEDGQVTHFEGWVYLQQDHLALFMDEKRVVRLTNNRTIKNIIDLLILGPMKIQEFFKTVTKTTYDHKIHEKYLYQILSKTRQALSNSSVVIYEDHIALL